MIPEFPLYLANLWFEAGVVSVVTVIFLVLFVIAGIRETNRTDEEL